MTRLAVFTPLPPASSGISQYSAELLPYLAAAYDLTVVIADDAPAPAPLGIPVTIQRASAFAATDRTTLRLYQLGNSPEHAYILAAAEQVPGVCVLHDLVLQHLQLWRALHNGPAATAAYQAAMQQQYGPTGAQAASDLLQNRTPAVPLQQLPLCEAVAASSLAVIVHSDYARTELLRLCPAAQVVVAPHGVPLLPQGDRAAARASLGLPTASLIVAAVGNLIPEKRLEIALAAFARALYHLPAAHFVVAGAASLHYDPQPFARHNGLEPVTTWRGRVSATEFEQLLTAANLCVNLRWPTGGETSGSLLRMLAAGRATLLTPAGAFAEVPPTACIQVPADADEEAALVRAMVRAGQEPAWADTIGTHARKFVSTAHSFARTLAGYRAAIDTAQAARARVGSW